MEYNQELNACILYSYMKRSYQQLYLLCSILWLFSGCGKKGDPLSPIVPLPLPVSAVSARVTENGVVLAWTPPTTYDTEKVLELGDIKYFSIYRKTEAPLDSGWNFDKSSEGWISTGQSLLPKQYNGVLRAASEQKLLTLLSPGDLKLQAKRNRFIRLKLWTKNAKQGYIAFITSNDTRWDREDITQEFEPAVHTSFYAVRQAFDSSKLKRFPIRQSASPVAQEYVIDMQSIPAWEGSIQQIGLILQSDSSEEGLVELGLDSVEFIRNLDAVALAYDSPPWIFLEDEEGWRILPSGTVSGATQGILYAEGDSPFVWLSAPGQRIRFNEAATLQLRMKATAGDEAYLILRQGGEKPFRTEKELIDAVSRGIRIPLKDSSDFSTYTLNLQQYIEALGPVDSDDELTDDELTYEEQAETRSQQDQAAQTEEEDAEEEERFESARSKKRAYFAQIGIVFPAVAPESDTRRVSIDYIDILPESVDLDRHDSRFTQQTLPTDQEIARAVHSRIQEKRAAFELSYEALPEEQEQVSIDRVLLAEISPSSPSPAELKGDRFILKDSGQFVVESEDGEDITAPLEYGDRYSYEIEVTDRKKRNSELAEAISVEFMRAPSAPENLWVEAGDEKVTLTWDRPIITEDGKKLKQLTGYRIFRSTSSGEYSKTPLTRVSASSTQFIDRDVTNRESYYYVIQALASKTPEAGNGPSSTEVSAMPLDISAPDAPTGLVGVYLNDKVNLHWNQVPTKDFAGFNVYRSDNREGDFQKLNDEILRKSSFTDETAVAKKRYYYYITALDDEVPPNESEPSELEPIETYSLD